MEQLKRTSVQYFKNMQTFHLITVVSSLILNFTVAFLYFKLEMPAVFEGALQSIMMALAILTIPLSIFIGTKQYNATLRKISKSTDIGEISTEFQKALIYRIALLEGAAFFNMIFAILLANTYLFLTAALGILYMATMKPTREKFLKEVEPTKEIADIYLNDEEVVV